MNQSHKPELPSVASFHVHYGSFVAWMIVTALIAALMEWLLGQLAMFITFGIGIPLALSFIVRLDESIKAAMSQAPAEQAKVKPQQAPTVVRSIVKSNNNKIYVDQKTAVPADVWIQFAAFTKSHHVRDWTRVKFVPYAREANVVVSGETFKALAGELRSRAVTQALKLSASNADEVQKILAFSAEISRQLSAAAHSPTLASVPAQKVGQMRGKPVQSRRSAVVTSGNWNLWNVLASFPQWLKIALASAILAAVMLVYLLPQAPVQSDFAPIIVTSTPIAQQASQ